MSTDLWAGGFGNRYHERNAAVSQERWSFWRDLYQRRPVASVLEVGCGMGANLIWATPPKIAGVDANEGAVIAAKNAVPHAAVCTGAATRLPFPDRSYELVFSCGVLIHIPSIDLPKAMDEMWRISSKYLLAMEYDATHETTVEYRGLLNALWKRPYKYLFEDRFALEHLESGLLSRPAFDNVTYHLWRKR